MQAFRGAGTSLYGRAYRGVWRLRAGEWGTRFFSEAAGMASRERLPLAEQVAYQSRRLEALLACAYDHIPFWRTRLDQAGVDPHHVTLPDTLLALPLLTKAEIRAQGQALVAKPNGTGRLIANATSGSTGQPLHFWQDERFAVASHASRLRYRRWYGYDFGERIAFLWGAHRDTRIRGAREWLRRALRRERWVNAFRLDAAQMQQFAALLNNWRPVMVVAYPAALHAFARYALQHGLRIHPPQAIECSAEVLWPEQRQEIEAALRAPVYDVYGSREFGSVAAECASHAGLHIFTDNQVLEVIRDGRPAQPGEIGEIVITGLTSYAMPLIRYQTGDLAVLDEGPCACGRTLPRLAQVIGRTNSVIALPNGRLVHGAFFSHLFRGQFGLAHYRVLQPALGEIQILLEGDDTLTPERLASIAATVRTQLDSVVTVSATRVAHIEPLPTGKMGYLISQVPVDLAGQAA